MTWFRNSQSGQVFDADEKWATIYRNDPSNEEIAAPIEEAEPGDDDPSGSGETLTGDGSGEALLPIEDDGTGEPLPLDTAPVQPAGDSSTEVTPSTEEAATTGDDAKPRKGGRKKTA